ncbi:MAG: GNAT family N-acetyltransferase [Anaerolineae bacterium]|nr:GNAT family N-acetyltransferase [Anaerolineae bacterium]
MIQDPKFCPQCGMALQMRTVADRERPVCPACGFIFYLNPIVAAAALVEREGKAALVRRGVEPGRGRWCLPSGYVELDESPEEAAVRETKEELGLRVEIDGLLNTFTFTNPQSQGVLLIYATHAVEGDLVAGDDATEAAWFGPDELPDVAFRQHREVLRQWRQARAVTYQRATLGEAEVVTMLSHSYDFRRGRELGLYLSDPAKALFVAVDQAQVVGFAALALIPDNGTARIESTFVLPRYRRWGIGTRLIHTCLDFVRSKGAGAVQVQVPITDLGWTVYVKSGFRVSGFSNDYYGPHSGVPETALLLTCTLGL